VTTADGPAPLRARRSSATASEIADGIFVVEHAFTNCYLIIDGAAVTLVDACFPATWDAIERCLAAIGLDTTAVAALVLTHGHFDHVGSAHAAQTRHGIPVWVHEDDHWLAAHPYRYRPQRNRLLYPLAHPGSVPVLGRMVAAGALRVKGVDAAITYRSGTLAVPGSPVAIPTPGHTPGHCSLHLPDRDVLISGDALVTLDPYTGRRGPRIVAPAATADVQENRRSLRRLAELDAILLLPGHGTPWRDGTRAAVAEALRS